MLAFCLFCLLFCTGGQRAHVLRSVFLKSSQLHSIPMFLQTVPYGISSSNSLNSLKCAVLKLRILTLLFAKSMFFEITNLTQVRNAASQTAS